MQVGRWAERLRRGEWGDETAEQAGSRMDGGNTEQRRANEARCSVGV